MSRGDISVYQLTLVFERRQMLNLKEYRLKANRLADFVPWAALAAEGIVLNKDGSFQRTPIFVAQISIALYCRANRCFGAA